MLWISIDPLDAFSPDVRLTSLFLHALIQEADFCLRFEYLQAIRSGLAEAQRVAGGSGTEEEKAEAAIEVQVYEALQAALKA